MRRLINATLTTNDQIHCFLVRCVIIIIDAIQHNDSYTPTTKLMGIYWNSSVRPSVCRHIPAFVFFSFASIVLKLCMQPNDYGNLRTRDFQNVSFILNELWPFLYLEWCCTTPEVKYYHVERCLTTPEVKY